MTALSYFATAPFWVVTTLSLLFAFLMGYLFTGPRSGHLKYQIQFANTSDRLILVSAFLTAETFLNLVVVSVQSLV